MSAKRPTRKLLLEVLTEAAELLDAGYPIHPGSDAAHAIIAVIGSEQRANEAQEVSR
jgi:hypothetical protein